VVSPDTQFPNGSAANSLAKNISMCTAIPAIEEKAKLYKNMIRVTPSLKDLRNPFWPEQEGTEMLTRVLVRKDFSDLAGDSMKSRSELEALDRVLFGVVYPTPKKG
jgi:hypothetical protein